LEGTFKTVAPRAGGEIKGVQNRFRRSTQKVTLWQQILIYWNFPFFSPNEAQHSLLCLHDFLFFRQFNRALFTDLLMRAARESLDELLSDPKYLGAKPGIIFSLQTWGRRKGKGDAAH
jgi:hypothetical protein